MKNPLLARFERRSGHAGGVAEEKAAKRLGARATLASGALDFDKGDYSFEDVLFDSKATINKSISLKHEWLEKIVKEAQGKKMVGAIHIQFTEANGDIKKDGAWVALPEWFVRKLLIESAERAGG